MVSRLRLCRAIQSARASASATVVIASTSTASYSPKTKVDVIGSKPSASPKDFGRSPTIAFPGAVKTFTLSVLDATGAVGRVVSFSPVVLSILALLLLRSPVGHDAVSGFLARHSAFARYGAFGGSPSAILLRMNAQFVP